ncbi:hypothetical protein CPB84DRAFT_1841899 [Gymnopilus junonius]|uniref:MYND-type domain-containing protein n=1 Tax=Gymnopilus junonius TaxID=109634 RepID=A0A9P5TU11_GYMJU|nr:hypothetical protein CPB84DRAFT_1841899 [Gymnopilus junonius]
MKRCSSALTYCSKECQTASWKLSHKFSCKIHPSIASPDDPDKPVSKAGQPKKFTEEWMELQVDKELSRWLQLWRSCFQAWTTIALDLPNHPKDRYTTRRSTRQPEDDPAKQYEVIDASVVKISDVFAANPDIEVNIDPTDFTRFRFVVILQNYKGEPKRLRLVQWNDPNSDTWRSIGKEESAQLAAGWSEVLVYSLENYSPAKVEQMLGKRGRKIVNSGLSDQSNS